MVQRRTDEELLELHAARTPGALDQLVERYAGELFGFLMRFVGSRTVAEDLVQETFLQVHVASGSFDRSRVFKPWLYTIAANKARDFLRSKGRRQEQSLDAASDEGAGLSERIAAEAGAQDSVLEADATRRRVRELVDAMPEKMRLILVLGHFQQLPYAEIATILEIPVGTVKSRLHAAVGEFAKRWKAAQAGIQTSGSRSPGTD